MTNSASKRFVVLANSFKKSGRCVAGREVVDGDGAVGGWIRPISDHDAGALFPAEMQCAGGRVMAPLDIVEVGLRGHARDDCHPEDWFLAAGAMWRVVGRFPATQVPQLEERPAGLWVESRTHTDRMTPAFLRQQPGLQSLYMIRPTDFHVVFGNSFNAYTGQNQPERRACFEHGGLRFKLGLTDPVFLKSIGRRFPEPGEPPLIVRPAHGDRCLLCISFTPLFHGYHYKVVATVLELP